ncbi:hypothetical protein GIB67_031749 [Kingdonia uniflora]|uniref:Uncharacterized protein n=1 Tax=Kingdonia uniflora TaxID=39325 RepID=A0A7J7NKU9_9MAGN|nr:hypothetical protein GIB67_031749 [Kingdonia uniflora]
MASSLARCDWNGLTIYRLVSRGLTLCWNFLKLIPLLSLEPMTSWSSILCDSYTIA